MLDFAWMPLRLRISPASGIACILFAVINCTSNGLAAQPASDRQAAGSLTVTSPSFRQGDRIPKRFTADGGDLAPALNWSKPPGKTKSLALIMDDPDAPAGTWTHWVIYNLPPDSQQLKEGTARQATLPDGSRQGRNSWGRTGYSGPAPPPGQAHRYFFRLYAADSKIDLKQGVSREDLLLALKGHVIAEGELAATYSR